MKKAIFVSELDENYSIKFENQANPNPTCMADFIGGKVTFPAFNDIVYELQIDNRSNFELIRDGKVHSRFHLRTLNGSFESVETIRIVPHGEGGSVEAYTFRELV